jgi:hypothetical protein
MTRSRLRGARALESDSSSRALARGVLTDQFDTGCVECRDDLGQRVDDAAYVACTRLHALDGGQGHSGLLRQRFLIHPGQGTSRSKLGGSDHDRDSGKTISEKAQNIAFDAFGIAVFRLLPARPVGTRIIWKRPVKSHPYDVRTSKVMY